MKIGELSKRTGVSIRMIRYYEAEGLLAPHRAPNGYRDYDETDIMTINRIRLLGSAGMFLATIRQFLPCIRGEGAFFEPCDELQLTLRKEIDRISTNMAQLENSRKILQGFLAEIEGAPHPRPRYVATP